MDWKILSLGMRFPEAHWDLQSILIFTVSDGHCQCNGKINPSLIMMREWSVNVLILSIPCKHLAPVSNLFSSPFCPFIIFFSSPLFFLLLFVTNSIWFWSVWSSQRWTGKLKGKIEGIHVCSLIVSCKWKMPSDLRNADICSLIMIWLWIIVL